MVMNPSRINDDTEEQILLSIAGTPCTNYQQVFAMKIHPPLPPFFVHLKSPPVLKLLSFS